MRTALPPIHFRAPVERYARLCSGGIRVILWNVEPVEEGGLDGHYGLGYDHDLNDRLSLAATFRYAINSESVGLNYWSAYHFSNNDRTSFYMAPMVGIRFFSQSRYGVQVPVGFRMGVRGGLEKLYLAIYAGVHYNAGSSGRVRSDDGYSTSDLRAGSFCAGLDVGFGWDKRSSKY